MTIETNIVRGVAWYSASVWNKEATGLCNILSGKLPCVCSRVNRAFRIFVITPFCLFILELLPLCTCQWCIILNGFTAVWFLQAQGAQMQDLATTVRQFTASSRVQPETPQHSSLPCPFTRAQAATAAITRVRDSSLRCNRYVISKCKITSLVTVAVFNK